MDGTEDVGRGLDVLDHQLPQDLGRLPLGGDEADHGLVVVGRAADGLFEDGRFRGDAGETLVSQACELARGDELAADVVQPQRLAQTLELLERRRSARGAGCHGYFILSSLAAAATTCLAEIPAAFSSSSGWPDPGSSLTARCATRGGDSEAKASITAAPSPPSG